MSERYLLDVVIPVHDNLEWLNLCLMALHNFTTHPHRVTVVDNASSEVTRAWLRNWESGWAKENVNHVRRVLYRDQNDCFATSVNAGLALALETDPAPYLVILNSDVVVQEGWDEAFLTELAEPGVGLTGARTNFASGLQGQGAVAYQEAPYLIFCCVGLRADVYQEVGPLDDTTCPNWGGGEDLDYSWRVQDAGYRVICSGATVLHAGSRTYAALGYDAHAKARAERANMARLEAKYGQNVVERRARAYDRVGVATLSESYRTNIAFVESLIKMLTMTPLAGVRYEPIWSQRNVVHLAREQILEVALNARLDYLLFLDDDMVFPRHLLRQLYTHIKSERAAMIGTLAYKRRPPHQPCVYRYSDELKGLVTMAGIEQSGLLPVDAVGFGGVLIDLAWAAQIDKPRFEFTVRHTAEQSGLGEDMDFCQKMRAVGGKILCDTDLVLGHMGDPVVVDEEYVRRYARSQA